MINKGMGVFSAQQAKHDIVLLFFVDMMKILNFPLFSAKIKIPGKDDLTFFSNFFKTMMTKFMKAKLKNKTV